MIGSSIYIILLKTYNSTEHSVTQIKPNETGKKENHLWVNWHLQNKAKSQREYPDIKDGVMVRFKLKPSIGTKFSSTEMESVTT